MIGSPPRAGSKSPAPKIRSQNEQRQGDADHRGGQDLNPGGGVEGPDEERHPPPGHPLGAQAVDGGDEIEPGEDRGEAEDEDRRSAATMTLVVVWVLKGT